MTTPFHVQVDGIREAEWSALLEGFGDANLYQTWAYGDVRWNSANLSHIILRRGTEVVAAAQLRIVKTPLLGGGMAYLRWGPLWRPRGGAVDPEVVSRTLAALRDEYVARRGLVLRINPRVFTNDEPAVMITEAFAAAGFQRRTESPYRTFLLDLTPDLDTLRSGLEKKWRKHLRQAEGNELRIVEGTGDELWASLTALYAEMLGRKKFAAFVDPTEFRQMQARLPDAQKMTLLICMTGDQSVSAAVFSGLGDTGLCLLAATPSTGRELQASFLVKWKTIEWMKQRGMTRLDLGGRDPDKTPEVDHFKAGMGGSDAFHVGEFQAAAPGIGNRLVQTAEAARQRWRRLRQER